MIMPVRAGPPIELLVTELVYFVFVATLCLIIYAKTKKLYNLTKHRGIFYFKNIFLFFSLAYVFRLVHMFMMMGREALRLFIPMQLTAINLVLVGYLSTMAILSLAVAALIRKMKTPPRSFDYVLHGLAFLSSLVVFINRSHEFLIIVQGAIVLALVLAILIQSKSKISYNHVTYFLLALFWIVNTLAFTKHFLPRYFKIPLYAVSIILFTFVFIRVHKRLVSHAKKKRQT